jgi:hypothetical protein
MLKMKIITIITVFIVLMTASCISQFTPEIVSQNRYLTVNGLVTDQNSRYSVKLGISKPLNITSQEEPAKNALVTVLDDLGNSYIFQEKSPGYYVSDSTILTGQPGRSYTLNISYNDKDYTSGPCLLRETPPIDTIWYEVLDREINASGETEKYVRIALNSFDPGTENHYFRWTYDETWEIHLPFNNLPYEKSVCWMNEESKNIVVANTEALSEDRITDLTLTTFNNATDRGQYKYSILTKQYAISREEYEYWNNVKTMSENSGGLYDVTPLSITGNIECLTDPEEIVLGFFSVSGQTRKRIFLKSPLIVPDIYKDKCVEDVVPANPRLPGLGVYVFILNIFENEFGSLLWEITSNIACTDCAYFASNVRPDYWDEGFSK